MIDALRVTWQGLKDLWEELILLIILNIVWSLVAILAVTPILLLFGSNLALGLALSLVIFWVLPIVTGALCFVANQITRGYAVGWETFVQGLKRYWLKSLAVAGINLVALTVIGFNIFFYALEVQGSWTYFAVSIWGAVGIYWLLVQIYWFPMLLELESERIFRSLRNALAMPFIAPGFSTIVLLVLIALALVSTLLRVPLVLLTAAMLLLIMNRATRNRLAMIQQKREAQQAGSSGRA